MTLAAAPAASGFGTGIDDGWYRDVTDFAQRTHWLQPFMSAYTTAGVAALAALAVLAWWLARRAGDFTAMTAVAWTGIGTVLVIAVNLGLKQVFTETRPCDALAHVVTVQPCPGLADYSFPSNHTTIAVALAVGVLLVNRRLGAIAIALAALEGFSRVYLGQHYPHDVLAAAAISSTLMLLGWPVVRRPLAAVLRTAERTPLRPLLTAVGTNAAATAAEPQLHETTAG